MPYTPVAQNDGSCTALRRSCKRRCQKSTEPQVGRSPNDYRRLIGYKRAARASLASLIYTFQRHSAKGKTSSVQCSPGVSSISMTQQQQHALEGAFEG